MNSFKRYLGALLVILGAILIVFCAFTTLKNNNGILIGAIVLMIAGFLLHIFLGKKQ